MSLLNDRPAAAVDDYDPMIYDVMREAANRLGAEYIWLARHCDSPDEWARLLDEDRKVWEEARAVRDDDRAAVEAKTAEFVARLRDLRPKREL